MEEKQFYSQGEEEGVTSKQAIPFLDTFESKGLDIFFHANANSMTLQQLEDDLTFKISREDVDSNGEVLLAASNSVYKDFMKNVQHSVTLHFFFGAKWWDGYGQKLDEDHCIVIIIYQRWLWQLSLPLPQNRLMHSKGK